MKVDVIDTSELMCGDTRLGYFGSTGCEIYFIVNDVNLTERGWDPKSIEFNGTYLILLRATGSRAIMFIMDLPVLKLFRKMNMRVNSNRLIEK